MKDANGVLLPEYSHVFVIGFGSHGLYWNKDENALCLAYIWYLKEKSKGNYSNSKITMGTSWCMLEELNHFNEAIDIPAQDLPMYLVWKNYFLIPKKNWSFWCLCCSSVFYNNSLREVALSTVDGTLSIPAVDWNTDFFVALREKYK